MYKPPLLPSSTSFASFIKIIAQNVTNMIRTVIIYKGTGKCIKNVYGIKRFLIFLKFAVFIFCIFAEQGIVRK